MDLWYRKAQTESGWCTTPCLTTSSLANRHPIRPSARSSRPATCSGCALRIVVGPDGVATARSSSLGGRSCCGAQIRAFATDAATGAIARLGFWVENVLGRSKSETGVEEMAKLLQRPAAKMPRPIGPSLLERVSWDDLRVFAVAGRELSLRKAAAVLRTSSSTVVRRIERLEEILGVRLFDRLPGGVALTAEGRSVFAAAQEMERASLSVRAKLDHELASRGVVKFAVTEGLGTFWIVPHLAGFPSTHPPPLANLPSSPQCPDFLR